MNWKLFKIARMRQFLEASRYNLKAIKLKKESRNKKRHKFTKKRRMLALGIMSKRLKN